MLARNVERLRKLEQDLPNSKAYMCDVSDAAQVEATVDQTKRPLWPKVRVRLEIAGHVLMSESIFSCGCVANCTVPAAPVLS
jgi:hypothetical protein